MSSSSEKVVLLICDAESSGYMSIVGECERNIILATRTANVVQTAQEMYFCNKVLKGREQRNLNQPLALQ